MLATVCGVPQTVVQLLPPQNGAIARTDSVRTKAHLQNFETCMRNLHWQVFVSQKMHEKFQVLVREILVLLYIIAHSASHFMRRIVKNGLGCNSSILILCVLMLTRQNMCIQPPMTFKIWFRGLWNCTFSLWTTPQCRCSQTLRWVPQQA